MKSCQKEKNTRGAARKDISVRTCQERDIIDELSEKYIRRAVRKEISVRICQERDIIDELSEKNISEELSGHRYH